MKDYPLSLSRNYVANWSVEDAVRELVQNAIPSGNSTYYVSEEDGEVIIHTPEVKLHQSVLLLGSGTKTGVDTEIGGFSEGLKLSLLILAREGIEVQMLNHDVLWSPVFKVDINFGCEMFFIEETSLQEPENGLTFKLKGFSKTEIQNIVDRNLPIQEYLGISYGKTLSTSYGDILLDKKGYVYVAGLYVCMSDLEYGYNFKPEHLPLNRDRQTVPNWEFKNNTARMWLEAVNEKDFVNMVLNEVPDVDYTKYCGSVTKEVRDTALQVFKDKYGEVPLAESKSEQEDMIRKGYTNTVYLGNSNFPYLVRSADNYIEVTTECKKSCVDFIKGLDWYHNEIQDTYIIHKEDYENLIKEAEMWEH